MNANFYTAIEAANHGGPQRALLETETGRTFTYGDLTYFLGDAEPGVVVCRPEAAELMQELCGGRSRIVSLDEDCGGTLGRAAAAASLDFATAELQPDDSAVIIYTSGTTGRSKGA